MNKRISAHVIRILLFSIIICCVVPLSNTVSTVAAYSEDDPLIVVSLGDSYSSGEGIEPFYGQDEREEERFLIESWLAHRSENSWPGLVTFVTNDSVVKLKNIYTENTNSTNPYRWYFKASSGATTDNITSEETGAQTKPVHRILLADWGAFDKTVEPQLKVFAGLPKESVDYVTITIGGNDVGFSDILATCIKNDAIIDFKTTEKTLPDLLNDLWGDVSTTEQKLIDCYKRIEAAAGKQAAIIVAGYPKLIKGSNGVITPLEAILINKSVSDFNNVIEKNVNYCRESLDMNIHFVDVERAFEGHEANLANFGLVPALNYEWINPLILGFRGQDIDQFTPYSAYSFHPNAKGAQAYADCVSKKIQELEDNKKAAIPPVPPVPSSTIAHTHDWASSWTSDGNGHWHGCSGCSEKDSYAAHTWKYKNENTHVCSVCGKATSHTWSEWVNDDDGRTRSCTAAGCEAYEYEQGPTIVGHTHSWSSVWSSDAGSHWHACSGCDKKEGVESHTFGDWYIHPKEKSENFDYVDSLYRVCLKCDYKEEIDCPFYYSPSGVEGDFIFRGIKESVKDSPFYSNGKVTIPDIWWWVTEDSSEPISYYHFGGAFYNPSYPSAPPFVKSIVLPKSTFSLSVGGLKSLGVSLSVDPGNKYYRMQDNCLISRFPDELNSEYPGDYLDYSNNGTIPSGIETIGWNVFSGFNFKNTDVVIPSGVQVIGRGAFYRSNITSVYIPITVNSIEHAVFWECANLREIRYEGTISQWWDNISFYSNADRYYHSIQDGVTIVCSDGSFVMDWDYYFVTD